MAVSIVIPAFNEEKYIEQTVDSCHEFLKVGRLDYEIIVINNASTDNTWDILEKKSNLKLINLDKKLTVAAVRNIGWKAASNYLVAFIDGDMLITQDWASELESLDRTTEANSNQITGCKCYPSKNPSWIEKIWFSNANFRNKTEKYINSGNLITTKDVLIRLGGFDEALITGEDVDICVRAKQSGALLVINEGFKIYHEGYPKTISAFLKREQWHGVGDLKSLNTFLNSKVAVTALTINLLLICAFMLAFLNENLFLIPFSISLLLIVLTSHLKFKVKASMVWLQIYFLQFLYFLGRFSSFLIRKRV